MKAKTYVLTLLKSMSELLQGKFSNICVNFADPYNEIRALLLKRYVRPHSEGLDLLFQSPKLAFTSLTKIKANSWHFM